MLAALGLSPDQIVRAEPLAGGLSGSRVTRLTLARPMPGGGITYATRILKELRPLDGWLGLLSDDSQMREVALRETGLLDALPRTLDTATEHWARQGDAVSPEQWGALLLRDERGHLMPNPLRTPTGRLPRIIAFILERLARLHARFWYDPRLTDPRLGLTSQRDTLLLYAPNRIAERLADDDPADYLPLAAAGWDAFFQLAPPEAAATLRTVIATPEPWVKAIDALPFTLLHADVWGPNLGILPPTQVAPRLGHRLLLLDWALTAAGPATYDPLSLCGAWHTLDPRLLLAYYRARLNHSLAARGIHLSPATWLALADASYLRTALTCGEAFGRAAALAPAGILRQHAEARVHWWAQRGAAAARRLTEPSPHP